MASNPQEPYKGPILIQCSACSGGDHEMKYHDHEWVPVWNRASPLPAEPPLQMGVDVALGKDSTAYWCPRCKCQVEVPHKCPATPSAAEPQKEE